MAIRPRLRQKYKKIPYHREFGSLANPPIRHGLWPNGAFVISEQVPGRKGKRVVLGWIVRRDLRGGYQSHGVWIATRIGFRDNSLVATYSNLTPHRDHKYIDDFIDYEEALYGLRDAWVEHHGVVLR